MAQTIAALSTAPGGAIALCAFRATRQKPICMRSLHPPAGGACSRAF